MEFLPARQEDVPTYAAWGRAVQAWLQGQGLEQYVPAAHDAYFDAIHAQVDAGTLYAVWSDGVPVGFFSLTDARSVWWPDDAAIALYLSGVLVSPDARGRGIGKAILDWCVGEALRRNYARVRLDCHAGNRWLCHYYEAAGFVLQGQVEQHPGYYGNLYECQIADARRPVP